MTTDTDTTKPITVVIVDDHAMVRSGLEQLLQSSPGITVVGTAPDGEAAIEAVGHTMPQVVLMDISMPHMDGIEATRAIRSQWADVHVVMLTSFGDREQVSAAIDAGASGYLLKDSDPDEVVRAVHAAAAGNVPLDPRAARMLLEARPTRSAGPTLTAREREVLALIGEGLPNKRIGLRLGISEKTVKAHVTRVFAALGVTDRTQAALWVERNRGR